MATDHELTQLLEHCLGFAKQMIAKAGEFHPFGAEIGSRGALTAIGFWNGEENPSGAELYSYALNVMRQKVEGREIIAGAIAANANIPPDYESPFPDGIRVQIEGDGYARLIYLPYVINTAGFFRKKTVDYGELFAVEIEPAFFRK